MYLNITFNRDNMSYNCINYKIIVKQGLISIVLLLLYYDSKYYSYGHLIVKGRLFSKSINFLYMYQ